MPKGDGGFRTMDPDKRRAIAAEGGRAGHKKGTAHEWTSHEARVAGQKGGVASGKRRREDKQELVTTAAEVTQDAARRVAEENRLDDIAEAYAEAREEDTIFPS